MAVLALGIQSLRFPEDCLGERILNANWSRNAFVYLLILVAAAALFFNLYSAEDPPPQVSLSRFGHSSAERAGAVDHRVGR